MNNEQEYCQHSTADDQVDYDGDDLFDDYFGYGYVVDSDDGDDIQVSMMMMLGYDDYDFGDGAGGHGGHDDDIQVPMNRVVVGTAPSPNLTVSQAR